MEIKSVRINDTTVLKSSHEPGLLARITIVETLHSQLGTPYVRETRLVPGSTKYRNAVAKLAGFTRQV